MLEKFTFYSLQYLVVLPLLLTVYVLFCLYFLVNKMTITWPLRVWSSSSSLLLLRWSCMLEDRRRDFSFISRWFAAFSSALSSCHQHFLARMNSPFALDISQPVKIKTTESMDGDRRRASTRSGKQEDRDTAADNVSQHAVHSHWRYLCHTLCLSN